jgi:hypothetical protein
MLQLRYQAYKIFHRFTCNALKYILSIISTFPTDVENVLTSRVIKLPEVHFKMACTESIKLKIRVLQIFQGKCRTFGPEIYFIIISYPVYVILRFH